MIMDGPRALIRSLLPAKDGCVLQLCGLQDQSSLAVARRED
jgi:hypothetical protein